MPRPVLAPLRREQILNGLFSVIAQKGFQACSISDVARASGLARGILHYYFDSKEEMLAELMRSLGQVHLRELDRYLTRFTDPLERLLAVLRFHLSPQDDTSRDMTRVWIEFWAYGLEDPKVRKAVLEVQDAVRERLESTLDQGLREGRFVKVDRRSTAVLLLSLVEGPMLQRSYHRGVVNAAEILSTASRMILAFLSAGAKASRPGGRRTLRPARGVHA